MRKLLFLLICALLLVAITAPAAVADKNANAQTLRPPANTAVLWDGWWFDYSADGDTGVWWLSTDPKWKGGQPPWPDYKAVPRDRPVVHFGMWIGVDYGYMLNIPNSMLFTIDIWGPGWDPDDPGEPLQHFGVEKTRTFWTGPYLWDDFWTDFYVGCWIDPWEPETFNPNMGAEVYGNNQMVPLDPLVKRGWYHMEHSWWTARPMTEKLYYGEPGRPVHTAAGAQSGTFAFDVYVQ
jgi:hypothetical protein